MVRFVTLKLPEASAVAYARWRTPEAGWLVANCTSINSPGLYPPPLIVTLDPAAAGEGVTETVTAAAGRNAGSGDILGSSSLRHRTGGDISGGRDVVGVGRAASGCSVADSAGPTDQPKGGEGRSNRPSTGFRGPEQRDR